MPGKNGHQSVNTEFRSSENFMRATIMKLYGNEWVSEAAGNMVRPMEMQWWEKGRAWNIFGVISTSEQLKKGMLLMILNISIQLNVWHERQFRMSPIITTTTQHRLTIARSWRCIFGSADLMDALCTSSVKRHRSVPSSHSIEILFSAPSSKLSIRLSAPSSVNLLVNSVFHHSFRKITEWIAFTRRMCARV